MLFRSGASLVGGALGVVGGALDEVGRPDVVVGSALPPWPLSARAMSVPMSTIARIVMSRQIGAENFVLRQEF